MTHKEIYTKLLNYKSIDRIQLVREDYKGTNEGFNEQLTNMINEIQNGYDLAYYERLNNLCMILDKAEYENDLDRIKIIECQIKSHEKSLLNPFLVLLRKDIEVYIKLMENQQLEKKGILTNETYYNLLENCTIEAFESLKSKELYPKNGAKAIWDVSTLTITKGDGLPTDADNNRFRKKYIEENMRVTFLMALERFCKDFEIKHSITSDFFYKKCYQSILFKTSQSSLWYEPDFGFDIDAEPCLLTFIWNMRTDIEAKNLNHQHPTTTIPEDLKTVKPKRLKKILFEFIHNIKDKKAFTQELKNTFPTEIGKSIKAMIDILTEKQILIYGTKEFKQLFEELEKYFCRNIGSYNSIQNVKVIDKETTETVSKKLNPLIIKYTTT